MEIEVNSTLRETLKALNSHIQGTLIFLIRDDGTLDTENPIYDLFKACTTAHNLLSNLDYTNIDEPIDFVTEFDMSSDEILKLKEEMYGSEG